MTELEEEKKRDADGVTEWTAPSFHPLKRSHQTLWRHYLTRPKAADSLAKCIDINAEARFATYTYRRITTNRKGASRERNVRLIFEGKEAGTTLYRTKEPQRGRGFEKGGALKAMLGMLHIDPEHCDQVTDDRARVLTSIILEGQQPDKTGENGFGVKRS